MKRVMKKLLYILVAVLICSCDFLDETNYTERDSESFFSDAENIESVVNGCYDAMQDFATAFVFMTELASDYICVPGGDRSNSVATSFLNGINNYSDTQPTVVWTGLYKMIYRCNYLIDNIHYAEMEESLSDRYIGEVRFLRGWAYLMLTNLWGDVPLRTTSNYGTTYDLATSSQEDVYDFLIKDLIFAGENLPNFDSTEDSFRASQDAAYGVLGVAYLYRAKTDTSSPYWQLSHDALLRCINNRGGVAVAGSQLSTSYAALYKDDKFHSENLFAIYFSNVSGDGSSIANNWAIYRNYSVSDYHGTLRMTDIWYEKHFSGTQDKRNIDMIHHDFETPAGVTQFWPAATAFSADLGYDPQSGSTLMSGYAAGAWCKKFDDPDAPSEGMLQTGLLLLRYAEVLLAYAEVESRINGVSGNALTALNAVRERAGVSSKAAGDFSSATEFRSFILEERERELFVECKRLFDLNRTEQFEIAVEASSSAEEFNYEGAEVNRERSSSTFKFAIPKSEIDSNGAINI